MSVVLYRPTLEIILLNMRWLFSASNSLSFHYFGSDDLGNLE